MKKLIILLLLGALNSCDISKDHIEPELGDKYYRLKIVNKDGSIQYSNIISR